MTSNVITVTLLILNFQLPFDKEFWSGYKALEKIVDKPTWKTLREGILTLGKIDLDRICDVAKITKELFLQAKALIQKEWDELREQACERGTKIHQLLEGGTIDLSEFGFIGNFIKSNSTPLLEDGLYPEFPITALFGPYTINGRIDLLYINNGKAKIVDYKTNQKIVTKAKFNLKDKTITKMKYPLCKLDDVNFNHALLLLSLYAWIFNLMYPNITVEDLLLQHIDEQFKPTTYHCDYLKDEILELLKFYNKKQLLEERLARRKPIIY